MPSIRLSYFDAPGRAESVRVALFLADMPFTDERLSYADFAAKKAAGAFPLGSVPVMEIDGLVLTQTSAMLRYVARVGAADLYPTDPMQAFLVDSVLETFNDTLTNALLPSLFERDMEKKLAMRAEWSSGPLVRAFDYTSSLIERSGGPFVTGAKLTVADILVALQALQIRRGVLDGVTPETVDRWPRIAALADAYAADPRIAAYAARGKG